MMFPTEIFNMRVSCYLLTGQEADHITEIAIQGHGQGAITGGQDSE